MQQVYKQIIAILKSFNGNIVQQKEDGLLISFRKVTEAILCALKIHETYRIFRTQYQINFTELSIGVDAGIPVTDKKSIFEDTIKMAQRMCFISSSEIIITSAVKQLFESENFGEMISGNQIHILSPVEEIFVNSLMEFTEREWQNAEIKVEDFEKNIGVSKSKLYRELIRLTGKSPQVFLLHFKLRKALQMLQKQEGFQN